MSEQLREALSAIVDGEASEFELRRVLDEMGKDEGLLQAWQSYHLIRQAASGENTQGVNGMRERMWAALDADEFLEQDILQEEPAQELLAEPASAGWGQRGLWGGAIAAALVAGVLFLGDFSGEPNPAGVDQLAETQTLTEPPAVQAVLPVAVEANPDLLAQSDDADYDYGPGFVPYSEMSVEDRMRNEGYFLHHVQHRAVNNDNVLSFVKMISYPQ